jgi:hypothetical protein
MLRVAYIGAPPTITVAPAEAEVAAMPSSIVEQAESQLALAVSRAAAAIFEKRI